MINLGVAPGRRTFIIGRRRGLVVDRSKDEGGMCWQTAQKHRLRGKISKNRTHDKISCCFRTLDIEHCCVSRHLLLVVRQGQVVHNHRGALSWRHCSPHRRRFAALERASPSPHAAATIPIDRGFLKRFASDRVFRIPFP